ncbi:DUF1541 domain-containing protein [Stenoxybacter acetivorans]|uniref:DUF1541 domain-containing protein n=1 Tax=Stenoxybacter acetivorans TaxID=422441 RepID=UPI00055DFCC9|nr:DUF1541 domain-containing protein [Stenoxybacter acetivorans]
MNKLCTFLFLGIALSACAANSSSKTNEENRQNQPVSAHGHLHGNALLPANMTAAVNPKYAVGQRVVINEEHMPNSLGAKGVVKGAYRTNLIMVSFADKYGNVISNHKWVVQEELADKKIARKGDKVKLSAAHLGGDMNAAAFVDDVLYQQTAYVVDYLPTDGGAMVEDHMWYSEQELLPDNTK